MQFAYIKAECRCLGGAIKGRQSLESFSLFDEIYLIRKC